MENLGMTQFGDVYKGRRVLLTGHTGFKGSWLCMWLRQLGAELVGVSLAPERQPNHWKLLGLQLDIEHHEVDIRNPDDIARVIRSAQPEMVFHLAAQPLVRRSYRDPLETWSTNVIGTANVLEACRRANSVRAILVVTTDKCYQNQCSLWGYRETDRLGGHDPYSASKAGAEMVAASFRSSFFSAEAAPLLATARAGNVIGGGDWSEDRLIPDVARAIAEKKSLEIRAPNAIRPWQHVLESLSGYLLLGKRLFEGDREFEGAWNFGPERTGNSCVTEVLEKLKIYWPTIRWHETLSPQPYEANLLYLDSAKAQTQLGWYPVWNLDITIEKTAYWYQAYLNDGVVISEQQLAQYIEAAKNMHIGWV
jgi:CDP-glucose 4,6-dehydratase